MTKKHNWKWYFRLADERNTTLLINFKKHLQFKDKAISKDTIQEYQKDVYGFMIWLQQRNVGILFATIDMLIEYMDSLDVSEARKTRILSSLNQFYKLNSRKKYCEKNLVEEYKKSNK